MTELAPLPPHICKKCVVEYPLTEYAVNKTYASGRDNTCRSCRLVQRRENYHRNILKPRPDFKVCATCGVNKSGSDFPQGNSADGLRSHCKDCKNLGSKMSRYNLTTEAFMTLLAVQNGKCAICETAVAPVTSFHVDHNHSCCPYGQSCGKCIRGLLCGNCNTLVIPGYERLPEQLKKCPVINKYLGGI